MCSKYGVIASHFIRIYVDWKAPVTFTEGVYETKPFSLTFKYDTTGKTGVDLKMKELASGLTVTAKAAQSRHGMDGELVNEYLVPDSNVHSSLSINGSQKFAFSTAFKPTASFILGAEITGTTNMNNLKLAASNQLVMGKSTVGARLTQDFNTGATHVESVIGLTEGNTDLLVSAHHNFAKTGLPSATFLVKHNVDKNLWVKAAVNDALEVKVASGYKMCNNVTTTLGFAINNNAKTDADKYKVGLKAIFAL